MAANFNLIIVHGPPSPVYCDVLQALKIKNRKIIPLIGLEAVSSILQQRLEDENDYVCVYPPKLYEDNPGFGVRDVANAVLGLVKKHKKVVVEDCIANGAVRDCLQKVINSKLTSCALRLVELEPKHGHSQLLWQRQFSLASSSPSHRLMSDETIHGWLDHKGKVYAQPSSAVASMKGSKETVSVNLTAASQYKFEVPALLIQLECALDSGGYLEQRLAAACERWSRAVPCGRVILLADGNRVSKGQLSAAQEKAQIIRCVKELANELPCPVYVLQLTSTLDAGHFCVPPAPGLLAFLHRRHLIHLQHKSTLYVYKDITHMKMSERAGVRHIQLGKVFKSPDKFMTSQHVTACPVPEMLRQMEVFADRMRGEDVTSSPAVPLSDRLQSFDDQHICLEHQRGHREFVFAKDSSLLQRQLRDIQGSDRHCGLRFSPDKTQCGCLDVKQFTNNNNFAKDLSLLQRFQTLYSERATSVGVSGSRITEHPPQGELGPSTSGGTRSTLVRQPSEVTSSRQMPQWMLGRRDSSSAVLTPQATLEKSASCPSGDGRGRSRNTVYIMTEKELLDTAKEILKQAGREDLITAKDSSDQAANPAGSRYELTTLTPDTAVAASKSAAWQRKLTTTQNTRAGGPPGASGPSAAADCTVEVPPSEHLCYRREREREETSPSERKKTRFWPSAAEPMKEEEEHSGVAADTDSVWSPHPADRGSEPDPRISAPQKNKTHPVPQEDKTEPAPQHKTQPTPDKRKLTSRKPAPDLSVLDEIFS